LPISKCPVRWKALDDILRSIDSGMLQAPAAIEGLLGAQIALPNNRAVSN
jgi:hypothetical protein